MDYRSDISSNVGKSSKEEDKNSPAFETGWAGIARPVGMTSLYPEPLVHQYADGAVLDPIKVNKMYLFGFLALGMKVAPATWATAPDGTLLVLIKFDNQAPVWVGRKYLMERGYTGTRDKIKKEVEAEAQEDVDVYWAPMRKTFHSTFSALSKVHLAREMIVSIGNEPVILPAGAYPYLRIVDGKVHKSQRAPYSVIVQTGDGEAMVNPDLLIGVETGHLDEARSRLLDSHVPAEKIRTVFATDKILGKYAPTTKWLTADHIHYLTPVQMGAACVLKRMPAADEIATAKTVDQDAFMDGTNTPGVRFAEHIFIRNDQLGTGTEYHEALHKLSHNAVRTVVGNDFNEGVTEYFTQLALQDELGKTVFRGAGQYSAQLAGIKLLVESHVVETADLAAAYFAGDLARLFAKINNTTGSPTDFSIQAYAESLCDATSSTAAQHILAKHMATRRKTQQ